MPAQKVMDVITDLIVEHRELIAIVEQKTESIKSSDMDALSKLMMKERKQVQAITQLEEKRQTAVEEFYQIVQPNSTEKSVSNLLEQMENAEEKEQMEQRVSELVEEIVKLKQIEQLNKELLEQSMAFVQLSLDMLQPSMQNMNYGEKRKEKQINNTSVFDSKA